MKRVLPTSLLFLLLVVASNAHAWWGTPYNGYWPNAWPNQNVQRGYYPYGVQPWRYNGPDWKMRGYMTDSGDVHIEFKYRGNMNNNFPGGYGGHPGYGAYPQPPYYGYGWR